MDLKKNYAEVLIDGKVYTLGGAEEASYFQQVAAYVNHKLGELRSHPGFLKQKEDYQLVMLEINMADDYFKAKEEADQLKRQREEMDRDLYSIKHELINTQMKLEDAQRRVQELEDALEREALERGEAAEERGRRTIRSLEISRERSMEERASLPVRTARRDNSRSGEENAGTGDSQEDDRRRLDAEEKDEHVEVRQEALQEAAAAAVKLEEKEEISFREEDSPLQEQPAQEKVTIPDEAAPESDEQLSAQEQPVEKKPEALSEEEQKAKEEEEKKKALAAARVATEQLLKSRAMQMSNRGRQNRKK